LVLSQLVGVLGRGDQSKISIPNDEQSLSAKTWQTKKGTLALDDHLVSIRLGDKTESMALGDIKSVETAHLTLMQWLGWSGCLMWTGVGLLLAPFMLLVPALLIPLLLFVPTPWLILLKNTAERSVIVTIGPRAKTLEIVAAILAARARLETEPTLVGNTN
jgi:hypothetical protein